MHGLITLGEIVYSSSQIIKETCGNVVKFSYFSLCYNSFHMFSLDINISFRPVSVPAVEV